MKNLLNLSILFFAITMMVACKNDKGEKATVNEEAGEVKAAEGETYMVNTETSKVLWEGSKPAGTHNGTINISEGTVSVMGDKVTAGTFTMDMGSVTVLDLEGEYKGYLEAHLKGLGDDNTDDFFNVNKYPTSKFEITKVTALEGDPDGNHLIYGNLTLKDMTKEVGFKAFVDIKDNMVRVTTPQFTIDRTEWGIKYNSSDFFDNLKDKAIDNEVGLKINLVASK